MELFILALAAGIFAETSFLVALNIKNKSSRSGGRRKVYVDTSALMDGRILAVAQTGFFSDELIIPRSVIREMQLLADGKDSEKRTRARAGMDVVNELERVVYFNTEILQDELDRTPVDERLIELAKKNKGAILTCDFNLGKVAATEGIEVLNINDVALALRNEYLPGDRLKLKIVAEGSNKNQGVGYMPDGTMAVVEGGEKFMGEEVEVEFVRFLQTSAGKMMFAKLAKANRKAGLRRQKGKSSASGGYSSGQQPKQKPYRRNYR